MTVSAAADWIGKAELFQKLDVHAVAALVKHASTRTIPRPTYGNVDQQRDSVSPFSGARAGGWTRWSHPAGRFRGRLDACTPLVRVS
jgi:hypothetical protein